LDDWKCHYSRCKTAIADPTSTTLPYPQVNVASLRGYFLHLVQNEIHCQNFLHSHIHTQARGDSQVRVKRINPGSLTLGSRGLRLPAPLCGCLHMCQAILYDRLIVVTHAIFPGYRRYKTNPMFQLIITPNFSTTYTQFFLPTRVLMNSGWEIGCYCSIHAWPLSV
jgi:hypothetical protein